MFCCVRSKNNKGKKKPIKDELIEEKAEEVTHKTNEPIKQMNL